MDLHVGFDVCCLELFDDVRGAVGSVSVDFGDASFFWLVDRFIEQEASGLTIADVAGGDIAGDDHFGIGIDRDMALVAVESASTVSNVGLAFPIDFGENLQTKARVQALPSWRNS